MKVFFLVRPNNHPASRYRVLQYLPYLNQHQINTQVEFFPETIFGWFKLLKKVKGADIVFIQKKMINSFWLKRLKKTGTRIIFDVDDAIMFNSSRHPSPDSPRRMARYIKTVQQCDLVIAGNSYLKSLTEPYNSKVTILPLAIDLTKYPVKDYSRETDYRLPVTSNQIILGWLGGSKSLFFLKKLLPVLENLAVQYPRLSLKIVCNSFLESQKITIIKKQWQEDDEARDILSFDIGLSVLSDDPWSRGKCGTKLLQYLAAGIPAIASPVGVHNEIIQNGVNGFLADTPEEWEIKITRLVENYILRQTLGLAGREIVEEKYSLDIIAPRLVEILKTVSGRSGLQ
ncbi:MAG: glycosyltransferase family 4 protein [Planctomycetota bacterium]